MSCEVFNESDFGMIEGSQQTFSVNLYNILGEKYENVAINSAEWRLSKYGETEMLVSKSSADGDESVVIEKNIITISIDSQDTEGLFGKFTHQLIITDRHGRKFIADLGKISIKPQKKKKKWRILR